MDAAGLLVVHQQGRPDPLADARVARCFPWSLPSDYISIRTKEGKRIKLDRNSPLAWAQREFVAEVERQYNAGLPVRIIVLKGRQVGISTVNEAILFGGRNLVDN